MFVCSSPSQDRYMDRYMEINLLKAMNHPNIVNHPQRVPWAQRALGPGRRWARGPGATYGGPRRPGPRALWAHGALWGWLTMFGWFIAFSKLISIYLSRYILLYMDRYTYSRSVLEVRTRSPYSEFRSHNVPFPQCSVPTLGADNGPIKGSY